MLIILPPSEAKRPPPEHGTPVLLDQLSFPALTPTRERVLGALIETSTRPDALRRLFMGPSLVDDVARNIRLRDQPTRPALEVYTGQLYDALSAATLSPGAAARANRELIIASSLWGALRPTDRIPSYRLDVCSRLIGLDRLEPLWRTVLPDVLAEAAGPHGIVLDLRSSSYQAIGMPAGLEDRTVTVRVQPQDPARRIGAVVAKRIRGEAARYLLESSTEPADTGTLAAVLGQHWPVRLDPPVRPGSPHVMTISPT